MKDQALLRGVTEILRQGEMLLCALDDGAFTRNFFFVNPQQRLAVGRTGRIAAQQEPMGVHGGRRAVLIESKQHAPFELNAGWRAVGNHRNRHEWNPVGGHL